MTEPSAACEQLTKPRLLYRRTAMLDTGMQPSTDGAGMDAICMLVFYYSENGSALSLSLSTLPNYCTKVGQKIEATNSWP